MNRLRPRRMAPAKLAGTLLMLLLLSHTVLLNAALFGGERETPPHDEGEADEEESGAGGEEKEEHLVLLNDDGETSGGKGRAVGVAGSTASSQPHLSDDELIIDRMPHSKPTLVPSPFEEFTTEAPDTARALDPKAEALYGAAVDVLSKRRWSDVVQRDLRTAYMDLEEAAQLGHRDAEKLLAYSYLFGDYRWSIDEALHIFEKLAARGSPDGHLALGFMHSTGVGVAEPNTARGLLHYTFAAIGGSPLAQMAVGYRYGYGISVASTCETALLWYKRVAKRVAAKVTLTGTASMQRIRIPDELEAMQGASSSAVAGTLLDSNVFSYYKYLAETGDMQAILGLAQLYLTGGKGVPLDLEAAAKYFTIASEAGSAQASGYLGKMYLEGTPATPQNNMTAFQHFKRAADKGSAVGQCGLGMMFLYGYGVQKDTAKALKFFSMAAEQGLADAQLHLGQMYFKALGVPRDFKQALKYFQLASQSGNLLAVYNLAQMHAKGTGVMRNCKTAMALYKNVAERGKWAERFMDAYTRWTRGAVDEAALRYMFLAELGYEAAQTNFAWLMDEERSRSQLFNTRDEAYRRALLAWQRAANQDYAMARVKLGDYKYYGLGTDVNMVEAADHYKIAATSHQNAQAMFNLGYMHESGLGVNRDLHLAKRYYDMAAETSSDAFVPVTLSLMKLRFEFATDYLLANLALRQPSMEPLHNWLGPDWDIYVMTVLCGIIALLTYRYLYRRRNNTAGNGGGGARQPQAAANGNGRAEQ